MNWPSRFRCQTRSRLQWWWSELVGKLEPDGVSRVLWLKKAQPAGKWVIVSVLKHYHTWLIPDTFQTKLDLFHVKMDEYYQRWNSFGRKLILKTHLWIVPGVGLLFCSFLFPISKCKIWCKKSGVRSSSIRRCLSDYKCKCRSHLCKPMRRPFSSAKLE